MAVVGKPRSFHKSFAFTVEFPGIGSANFQKMSELKGEVATIEQFEGGALAADKSPGRYKVTDVTLERGATGDLDLFRWFKKVANIGNVEAIADDDDYKKTGDLVQRSRSGKELKRWTLHDAFPVAFSAGSWDNTSDANLIESVTLTFKYFDDEDDEG